MDTLNGLAMDKSDILEKQGHARYATGWMLDVKKIERDTNKKLERCDSLGFTLFSPCSEFVNRVPCEGKII